MIIRKFYCGHIKIALKMRDKIIQFFKYIFLVSVEFDGCEKFSLPE